MRAVLPDDRVTRRLGTRCPRADIADHVGVGVHQLETEIAIPHVGMRQHHRSFAQVEVGQRVEGVHVGCDDQVLVGVDVAGQRDQGVGARGFGLQALGFQQRVAVEVGLGGQQGRLERSGRRGDAHISERGHGDVDRHGWRLENTGQAEQPVVVRRVAHGVVDRDGELVDHRRPVRNVGNVGEGAVLVDDDGAVRGGAGDRVGQGVVLEVGGIQITDDGAVGVQSGRGAGVGGGPLVVPLVLRLAHHQPRRRQHARQRQPRPGQVGRPSPQPHPGHDVGDDALVGHRRRARHGESRRRCDGCGQRGGRALFGINVFRRHPITQWLRFRLGGLLGHVQRRSLCVDCGIRVVRLAGVGQIDCPVGGFGRVRRRPPFALAVLVVLCRGPLVAGQGGVSPIGVDGGFGRQIGIRRQRRIGPRVVAVVLQVVLGLSHVCVLLLGLSHVCVLVLVCVQFLGHGVLVCGLLIREGGGVLRGALSSIRPGPRPVGSARRRRGSGAGAAGPVARGIAGGRTRHGARGTLVGCSPGVPLAADQRTRHARGNRHRGQPAWRIAGAGCDGPLRRGGAVLGFHCGVPSSLWGASVRRARILATRCDGWPPADERD